MSSNASNNRRCLHPPPPSLPPTVKVKTYQQLMSTQSIRPIHPPPPNSSESCPSPLPLLFGLTMPSQSTQCASLVSHPPRGSAILAPQACWPSTRQSRSWTSSPAASLPPCSAPPHPPPLPWHPLWPPGPTWRRCGLGRRRTWPHQSRLTHWIHSCRECGESVGVRGV